MKKGIWLALVLLLSHGMSSAAVTQVRVAGSGNFPSTPADSLYDTATVTVNIDPAVTSWIALSYNDNLYDLATGDNGSILPDGFPDLNQLGVDDYVTVTVSKGTNVSTTITLDDNDAYNCRIGNQAVISGSYPSVRAVNCVDWSKNPAVVHSDTSPETGQLTDFFAANGKGDYTFRVDFWNKYLGGAAHGSVWLLMDSNQANPNPTITLEPATYPDFQLNILREQGFTVKIRKEDGIKDNSGNWKLNWSTLIFATDAVDNSMHLISTVMDRGIVSVSEDDKEVRFNVKPNRWLFMNQHNVFNIQRNGEHSIALQICDTEGRCGSSAYTIYFGPFIWADSVTDLRCNARTWKEELAVESLVVGNIGYDIDYNGTDAYNTNIYVAIAKSEEDYWFLSIEQGGRFVWYHGLVTPFFWTGNWPVGTFATYDRLSLDLRFSYIDASGPQPFPPGNYTFSAMVKDPDKNASKGFSKNVTTCE